MRLAAQRGYVAVNPCDAVKLPSKKRAGVRRSHLYLEGADLRALAEAVPAHYRLPVYIAGSCGLRAGELWALRRSDIDLLHSEVTVRYALEEINSSAASPAADQGADRRPAQVRGLAAADLAAGRPGADARGRPRSAR